MAFDGDCAGRAAAPAVQLIVGALVGWRPRDAGVAGVFLGSAVALMATFMVRWQAYPHYYLVVTVLLILVAFALGADAAPDDRDRAAT